MCYVGDAVVITEAKVTSEEARGSASCSRAGAMAVAGMLSLESGQCPSRPARIEGQESDSPGQAHRQPQYCAAPGVWPLLSRRRAAPGRAVAHAGGGKHRPRSALSHAQASNSQAHRPPTTMPH